MPILTPNQLKDIPDVLTKMVTDYATKTSIVLTEDEVVKSFIDPEHVQKLLDVDKLVGSVDATTQYPFSHHLVDDVLRAEDGTRVPVVMSLGLNMTNGKPMPIPKYISGGLQKTAPVDVVARIRTWAMDRRRVGTAAAVGVSAVYWLNQTCGNAKAAAVMFPALTTLISRLPDNDRRGKSTGASYAKAQKVAESKSIGALPATTPKLRRLIYEASQVINSLVLVEAAPVPQVPKCGAFLWMHSSDMHPDTQAEFFKVGLGLTFI